ncbi:tyrosyl-tRNA synthetase-like protein [Lojkania enalia]|uniref:Tyrosine--tRNA ligase n=1 Tax=Lojkania enalia TaxID=147567 RepID=A0A9P4TS52_9PLEO|nr:tyrosyl-tRNA synthetase-like protein [Didymosphaeria enalia]
MSLSRHLPRNRSYVCQSCIQKIRRQPYTAKHNPRQPLKASYDGAWEKKAQSIRSGAQQSMLEILEERGFVKDVAGGQKALDWLLTEKRIGVYVGVDPTAPSLHVGHLLPLMALYWMYIHGFYAVTLLGGGTVQIGDPSGRTSARKRQTSDIQLMNVESMKGQLKRLWGNVRALDTKHQFSQVVDRRFALLNNWEWLQGLSAVELMKDLGSGMRLGTMLSRDSVKLRMENGDGMAISEFCYPLFQAFDWWKMFSDKGVQLQIGGSDQYGNICAGMDAVGHMRKIYGEDEGDQGDEDPRTAAFGLTTPLLTSSSGEKFGKSAGNAVWLDQEMLNSFDLYQYFLRTADDDVERYLKLFTFIPIRQIELVMLQQKKDASKRIAQHLLAKEVVELAHGAFEAKRAEVAHKETFSQGTGTYSLSVLRKILQEASSKPNPSEQTISEPPKFAGRLRNINPLTTYKKEYAALANVQSSSSTIDAKKADASFEVTIIPRSVLQVGSFSRILYAAGLVRSRSEGRRLIQHQGAYIVVPGSGSLENPFSLKWEPIPQNFAEIDPTQYLVDWEALVLRIGKSKIKICRVINDNDFEREGLSYPGYEEFKEKCAAGGTSSEVR